MDKDKQKAIKEEIKTYKEEKSKQYQNMVDRTLYKKVLVSTLRTIIIVTTIIIIVTIIAMCLYTGQNILKLQEDTLPKYLNTINIIFLSLCFDCGLGFIITSIRNIPKKYKKQSCKIGIEIIVCTILLGIIMLGVLV